MVAPETHDPAAAARQKIRRKARLFALGFFAAAVLAAACAGALVAWLFQPAGLPFVETWIASGVLILGIPVLWQAWRYRRSNAAGNEGRETRRNEPR